ncbi:NudC domain-containing protein 1, partial [Stegodyphus mimosarum]
MWNSMGQDGRLAGPKSVWEIPVDSYMLGNVTICFPGAEWAILCDGKEHLHVLYTPSRAAGEPWLCYHSLNLGKNNSCYILHAIHRSMPGSQQIDCIVSSVEDKSCLPEDVTFSQKSTFIAVLEWISLRCAQNIQVWTKKRTRKLASPSFPEYAAIDSVGDAICVISQGHFVMFYDSNGLSKAQKVEEQDPKPPLYTYIQTPEDITVYFRLPQHIKKTDIQIKFLPLHIEVSLQGKCVLSGQLGNYIDTGKSTWIMDGEKLEVILSKSETGLMWQELVKGNIQGEELMDPALINEIHSRLAHLTSETEAAPSDKVPFNLAQLEECDLSNEPLTFQRIDGNQHCETHRVHMGGHQWLFSQQICPESLPAVCLRHDVDGILWQ